ncbi:MAG: dihydroorotate dehydrogenase electron transfer subunit [Defluviitaleaceae bacterium]|nr:dihydroorotate dehydrogenase electron transfer subunit [Defluviitaleaceae bacterium]
MSTDVTQKFFAAKILSNSEVASDIFSMTLHAPEIAGDVKPGQFAMVYLGRGEMLLPRPISFCDANPAEGTVNLVYQVVGKGTKAMAEMPAGENVKILAPIGNGFFLDRITATPAIVGGGIGTPPLLLAAKALAAKGIKPDVFLGFRSNSILVKEFETVARNVYIATEDGSHGHKGYVTELLKNGNNYQEIISCGPAALLQALKTYAASINIPCQVSLEERMGCGVGTCVGCVVKMYGTFVRICAHGPVFDANEVDLNG